jgi:N-acetylmuramoyl-L-alanine amidase
MREIKYIVLHCTAGPQNQSVEVIQAYWKSLGWKSPGYHHLIQSDGTDAQLLAIEKPSNGVKGFNSHSIHISYIGGVEVIKTVNSSGRPVHVLGKAVDNRTPEQIQTQIRLVKKYKAMFPKAKILGHRDFSPDKNRDGIIQPNEWMKTCPSFSVAEWLRCTGLN